MTSQAPAWSDPTAFWSEVNRRKTYFFLTAVGWLPAAAVLIPLYTWVLPDTSGWRSAAVTLALVTWFTFWVWVASRLTRMRCYQCGAQAFSHPYFFMRHAKCQNC